MLFLEAYRKGARQRLRKAHPIENLGFTPIQGFEQPKKVSIMSLPALLAKGLAWLFSPAQTDEQRYLAQATDLVDLEQRIRHLEHRR